MRKKITLLMALALMGTLSVSGAVPDKKVAEITSEKRVFAEEGTVRYWTDSYYETFFYDKKGNETGYARYTNSKKTTNYTTDSKKYDTQNRLVEETSSMDKSTTTYTYDGDLLKEKVKKNAYNTDVTTYKYDGNGKLLSEEVRRNGSNDKLSSCVYSYDDAGKWMIKYTYGNRTVTKSRPAASVTKYVITQTLKYVYENGKLVSDTLTSYSYTLNEDNTDLSDPIFTVKGCSHYMFNADGTAKSDTIWMFDDIRGRLVPKTFEYFYENGLLSEKYENGIDGETPGPDGWKFTGTYKYKYNYSPVGADYVPTITGITAGEEFASIVIALTPPKVTEGLKGYKLRVDGVVSDETLEPVDGKIAVAKQARGAHDYSLVPVYEGMIPACASDEFSYTIDINLNKAQNLRLASCSHSVFGWNIKVRWDAPEDSDGKGTLVGYRMTSTTVAKPDVEQNQGRNITTLYNEMRQEPNGIYTYYLYAVYEEGESDPIKITEDFETDLTRVVVDYSCDNIAELKKAFENATDKTKEFTLNSKAQVKGVVRDANSKIYGIYVADNTGALKITGDVNAAAQHNVKNIKGTMTKTEKGQYVFNCTSLQDDGYGPTVTPIATDFYPFYEISASDLASSQSKFYSFKNVVVEVKTGTDGVKYAELTQKNVVVDANEDGPITKDVTIKMIDPSNKVFTAAKVFSPANITGAFVEIDADGKLCCVLKDAASFQAVVPAPTDLELVAYECANYLGSKQWQGKAVWKAPKGAEEFTFQNYKLTIVPVEEGKGYASPSETSVPYNYKWAYTPQNEEGEKDIVRIGVVAVYKEGTSEPCEIEFDFTDQTKVLRNYDKNDIAEMIASKVDPESKAYNFIGEATVAGIVPNYAAYIADAEGVMKVNFPAEKLTNLAMGSVITNMKGVLKQTSLGQWYFDATDVENTEKTATVAPAKAVNVDASAATNQNKLVVLKGVKMTVAMDPMSRGLVGKLTQVLYPGTTSEKTVTGNLYDPSLKVLAQYADKGELEVKSINAFVDIDQNENATKVARFILRGAPDDLLIEGVEEYATLKSVKEASFKENVTFTGKALVIGKVPNSSAFIYFLQDETGAIQGMVPFGKEMALGDSITNVVFTSYSKEDGFYGKSWEVVSSGNTVEPEARTLAKIEENGDADEAKFVKITKTVLNCKLDDEGIFFETLTLSQGTDTLALDYKGEKSAELAEMNGSTATVKCYVLNGGLRLSEITDITDIEKPEPVRANLKELKEGNADNCVVTGKVLVTGKVINTASYIYFLQDETANVVMMGFKADKLISKGDSIVNLRGYYEEGMFYFASMDSVSNKNEVKAEDRTLADFDPEADDARYLYIKDATLNFEMDESGDFFKTKPTLKQKDKTVEMDYLGDDFAAMKALKGKQVDVYCYVFDGKLRLSDPVSTEMKENLSSISAIGADRLYMVDGNVIAEGAVGITVYDTTGRMLVASESNQVSVVGLSGTLVVKVSYANGDVKVNKLMVK